ncbi:MAG: hypothetical protein ABIQ56_05790 [Chitinophagaceae bacterium]
MSNGFAQSGTYDVFDSSVVRSKDMPQQNEFWNNQYSFPAKPRNMWEFGVSAGSFMVNGDVPSRFPTFGQAVHLRKALGYLFSLRGQYLHGVGKGLGYQGSINYGKNPAWNSKYTANVQKVFYNYKATVQDFGLQGLFSLNNIRFHKQKSKMSVYAGVGLGVTLYHTEVNALDASGSPYTALFNSISQANQTYDTRKDVWKILKDNMDKSYETKADEQGISGKKSGKNSVRTSGTFIAGIELRLSKRFNIALEDRYTLIKDDLLDGQRWQENPSRDAALTGDKDAYNYASLGLNYNFRKNAVAPLWWINPLDYAYSELSEPRHLQIPKPVLDDTDGDGVIDQLDQEPDTPEGCPVDTHGVTADRDADGVPDCKDKQMITPSECLPVDADGVGKCPDPECCKGVKPGGDGTACTIGDLPSLTFKGSGAVLTADAKAMLSNAAAKIKAGPNCNITIVGYPTTSKSSQSLCQKRIAAIKAFLIENQSLASDRISTDCQVGGGEGNTVDLRVNM